MPMILGGVGLLVLIVFLVMFNSGGGDQVNDEGGSNAAKQPAETQKAPAADVPAASAKGGKTPSRAAPALSQETLAKMSEIYAEADAIHNAGIKLQQAGQKMEGSAKQSEAKVKIDMIKDLIEAQSLWYEEADMGGWAIPSEYVAMNKIYGKVSTLQKKIRMNGGK